MYLTGVFKMSSYIPISATLHKNKRWLPHTSFDFAKHDNITPIFANELAEAIHTLPIAFAQHEGRFILVVVMGLRANENLLVSEDGQWLAGGFTPVHYRSRPFALLTASNSSEEQILCIEESNLTEGSMGAPLFQESGELNGIVSDILAQLGHYNATRFLTQNVCDVLAAHGLLTPWEFVVKDGDTEQPFNGLYRIDEVALNILPMEEFQTLRDATALPVIYAQLLSMSNLTSLSKLLAFKTQSKPAKEQIKQVDSTFNFSGL
jgi:hypothetical protein